MKKVLILICLLLWGIPIAFIGFVFLNKPKTQIYKVQKTNQTPNADKLFSYINSWRKTQGFTVYIKDNRLCEIAKDRADDSFTHKGFYEKYSSFPYKISENLAEVASSEKIFYAWLNSPPHRTTLEKPYKYSCVACDKQCVQIFSNL